MGRRDRTFTGCWKCRARKVKCDETKPVCLNCKRVGVDCTGYSARLIWVRGDENVPVHPAARRAICCESTWQGFEVIPSEIVDLLIQQCDEQTAGDSGFNRSFSSLPVSHNPFSSFYLAVDQGSTFECESNGQAPEPYIPRGHLTALEPFPDRTRLERYLFHHYVTQVAVIMMPYDHPNNPWRYAFTAAFNLGQLGLWRDKSYPKMIESALSHYGNAMRTLVSMIGRSDVDIATVMTLMMAEVYSGRSQQWRHHLRGALDMLVRQDSSRSRPSILASRALPSTRILKTISDTSFSQAVPAEVLGSYRAPTSTDVVSTRGSELGGPAAPATTEFYFTMGVPRDVLECISHITAFRNKSPRMRPGEADDLLNNVLTCLRRYRKDGAATHWNFVLYTALDSGKEHLHFGDETGDRRISPHRDWNYTPMTAEVRLQIDAWVRAAYIYLYRSAMDAPPRAVRDYVAEVFSAVSSFIDIYSHGNLSLWPAFVAAVEATRDEDIEAARRWLDWTLSFGIGIRAKAKTVVEQVWRRRSDIAAATGVEKDLIVVDWITVIHELDCDILLI